MQLPLIPVNRKKRAIVKHWQSQRQEGKENEGMLPRQTCIVKEQPPVSACWTG